MTNKHNNSGRRILLLQRDSFFCILTATKKKHAERLLFQVEIDQDSLGDQMLPSLYAEDQTNAMNQERRREGGLPEYL